MTEKEAILRDLKVIAILDDKIDYSDHENIGAVLKLNPKSLFSTEYGDRYLERIRKMYDGEDYEKTCILCGSPLDGEGPICSNCYKMITIGNAQVPDRPKPIHTVAEEKPAAEEQPAEEEKPAEEQPVTPIVSYDAAKAAEEQKEEEGFADDAREVQQTYDELEQDVVDPKAKKIYAWRVLIMLFVVACFAIGIVCGLVLMIRRAGRIQEQYSEVTEQVVDTDFQEYDI